MIRTLATVSLALVLVGACTRTAPTQAPTGVSAPSSSTSPVASAPAPTPSAAASAASVAPASSVFAAWTDPAGLAELEKDCRAKSAEKRSEDRDPLACFLPWQQSCNYDPCWQRLQQCRGDCAGSCNTCDEQCGATCDGCKAACKDDACRAACAKTTASCKQACLIAVDHCSTADCAKQSKQCYVDEKQKWIANKCSWKKISECVNPCTSSKDINGCLARCKAKFPTCDTGYALMGSDPSRPDPPP